MLSWELPNPKLWGLGSAENVTNRLDFLGFGWLFRPLVKNLEFRHVSLDNDPPPTQRVDWDLGFGIWDLGRGICSLASGYCCRNVYCMTLKFGLAAAATLGFGM